MEVEENPEGQPPEVVEQSQALKEITRTIPGSSYGRTSALGTRSFIGSDMVTMIRMMRDELLYETSRL